MFGMFPLFRETVILCSICFPYPWEALAAGRGRFSLFPVGYSAEYMI